MAKTKQIYLDTHSESLWNEMFSNGANASAWIKEQLINHSTESSDPFVLLRKKQELTEEYERIKGEMKLIDYKIDQASNKLEKEKEILLEVDPHQLRNMVRNIKDNFSLSEKEATKHAKEYLMMENRPDLVDFIRGKL